MGKRGPSVCQGAGEQKTQRGEGEGGGEGKRMRVGGRGTVTEDDTDGSTLLVAQARTSAKRDVEMKLYRSKRDLVLLAYT
jgi:hypothetical protein